jgi:hypothetical protein
LDQDCHITIGDARHPGLEVAQLLAGLRGRQRIEICFGGCSAQDQQLMLAIHQKWLEDRGKWKKCRLPVLVALAFVALAVAYLGGFLDALWRPASPAPVATGDSLFADQASLYTFVATIALILGAIAFFVRRMADKAAQERTGVRLKETELSRRLAQDYDLALEGHKLVLTPLSQ